MLDFLDQYPILLPIIIFFGRIIDVALGTLRIIFVSKGEKYKAPLIGFFEVFIWIVVISQVFSKANDLLSYISYAAGYAAGNYVGIILEQRIAFGILVCKIYTNKEPFPLMAELNGQGYGTTLFEGMGSHKKVYIIHDFDPDTFYTVEDIRMRKKGIFPKSAAFIKRWRQGK